MKKKHAAEVNKSPLSFRYLTELTGIYLFLLFVIYPLYYEKGFSDIGDSKWHIFRIITYYAANSLFKIPTFMFFAVIGLIFNIVALVKRKELKAFFVDKARSTDLFVLLYGVLTCLTCILTPYRKYFVYGFPTWYMGLLSQLAFVAVYFFVAYYWRWNSTSLILYLGATGFVFLTGFLNRFSIDILSIYTGGANEASDYLSTIGQYTMYSGYVLTIFPLGVFIYWYTSDKRIKIASFAFMLIGFLTIITQNADSAFLGLIGMYGVLFWFSFDETKRMKAFLEILLTMLISWRIAGFLRKAFPDRAKGVGKIMTFFSENNLLWIVIAVVAILYALILISEKKGKIIDISSFKIIRTVIYILAVAGVIAVVLYIILNTKGLLPDPISFVKDAIAQESYLYFNEYWGNHRGIAWTTSIKTMICTFTDDPVRFILGCGPDEFHEMVYKYCAEELNAIYNEKQLICSHNEWLCQFVNGGILGGITYLGIFISAFVLGAKNYKKHPELIGIMMCIASYFAHNFFCYQRITCTPFIFVFIAAGISIIRYDGLISISENW